MAEPIFTQELQTYGVSLHRAILDNLIGEVEAAIADGRIRSQDGKHSVYDFIKVFFENKNPSQAWKTLSESQFSVLHLVEALNYTRRGGRKGTEESPGAEMVGLICIAYMGNSKFCQNLRISSASMIASDYRSRNQRLCFAEPSKSFDTITESYRVEALERALAESHGKESQLKEVLNNFPISIDELQLTTQIVNKAQIKAAIVRDLDPIRDYVELDGKIYLTLPIFHILCMSFRSMAGTDISRLPEILKVQTLEYFRLQEKRRANVRLGKRDRQCEGQIPLAF